MIKKIFQNKSNLLQLAFVVLTFLFLTFNIKNYPLADYDEATYAKVTIDTIKSGDLLTLKYNNNPWFEKPPLYFWISTFFVNFLGEEEISFRLGSILMTLFSLIFVGKIASETTSTKFAFLVAQMILVTTSIFYFYSRETRMDNGLVLMMIISVYLFLKGTKEEKYLWGILPAISIGLMFKNIISLLTIPIILIYSFFYKEWGWVKNTYFWKGLVPSALIFLPWHMIQTIKYGNSFWESYLGYHVIERAFSNITGSTDYFYYLIGLWKYNTPWTILTILLIITAFILRDKRSEIIRTKTLAPLFSFLFFIIIFTFAKTRLIPYILPSLPFLALFITESSENIFSIYKKEKLFPVFFIPLTLLGGYYSLDTLSKKYEPVYFEEKDIGLTLSKANLYKDPVYLLDFNYVESLKYYGQTDIEIIKLENNQKKIEPPFFIIIPTYMSRYFVNEKGEPNEDINKSIIMYSNKYFYLIYSDKPITLPRK